MLIERWRATALLHEMIKIFSFTHHRSINLKEMWAGSVGIQALRWDPADNSAVLMFKLLHKELIQEKLQIPVGMFLDLFSL